MNLRKIGVFPGEELLLQGQMLDALGELFMVSFLAVEESELHRYEAVLFLGVSPETVLKFDHCSRPCLAFIRDQGKRVSLASIEVAFGQSTQLHSCYRGRCLPNKTINEVYHLEAEPSDEILAQTGGDILWLRRKKGISFVDFVAMEAPKLATGGYLFQHFQKDNWIQLLPILHFLREVSGWEQPPLRACFMFDDPNLHWKTYGYVNFSEIAEHAAKYNYHVSFATVPMDLWHLHGKTVELFQDNKKHLSLLVHGNNHTYLELAAINGDVMRQGIATHAWRRVERFEGLSGLKIPRIMAAPHGACSHDMAATLLRTGFESACISRGSIMARNPNSVWPASVGLNPAEFLGDGLPIIPRFRLKKDCLTEILLAAFLGQPIIPVGHHEDLAGGLDLLQELAEKINSIGNVQWMDMEAIARSNYCTCREGEVLNIKMYSRKTALRMPEGLNRLYVHRPWLKESRQEDLVLRKDSKDLVSYPLYRGEPIPTEAGTEVEIHAIPADAIDPHSVPVPRTPVRAIVRRQLAEVRDRLRPLSDRLFGKMR